MKSYLFLLGSLFCGSADAQNCPQNYLGSKTLYPAVKQSYTPPPAGYAPVFINHVGRHGARHLTKDVATSYAFAVITKADSLGALTDEGKSLHGMILKLEKVEKKEFESISAEGRSEQQGLARRMMENYPEIFSPAPVINVRVAKKVRTAQSADAFISGLADKLKTEGIKKAVNDTILRFYDLAPAYTNFEKSGAWQPAFAEFKKSSGLAGIASQFTQRMFKPGFSATMSEAQAETLLDEVYGFVAIVPSLSVEVAKAGYSLSDVNFGQFFTCGQLATLSRIGDAEDFLMKGPGTDAAGIQVKIAAPLLMDFINTTDAAIGGGKPAVQLRFSHAETVAPFAALLGLHGAATPVAKLKDISNVWQASGIIPLSANIQWVLYQKKGGNDYLMKFLLNEKEVTVDGLKAAKAPYYKWADVRQFYIRKLQLLNAGLADDGYRYLQNVN